MKYYRVSICSGGKKFLSLPMPIKMAEKDASVFKKYGYAVEILKDIRLHALRCFAERHASRALECSRREERAAHYEMAHQWRPDLYPA